MRENRARVEDVEDKKKGIKIKKEDWQKLRMHIASYNYWASILSSLRCKFDFDFQLSGIIKKRCVFVVS